MKILATGLCRLNCNGTALLTDDGEGDCYKVFKDETGRKMVKVHIVSAEKPYCPKHGLIHGRVKR